MLNTSDIDRHDGSYDTKKAYVNMKAYTSVAIRDWIVRCRRLDVFNRLRCKEAGRLDLMHHTRVAMAGWSLQRPKRCLRTTARHKQGARTLESECVALAPRRH